MKRYLITIIESDGEVRAIDVVYCGSSWQLARAAWDDARMQEKWRGKRLRIVTSTSEREVISINETPIY